MTVIGIDPGNIHSAISVYDGTRIVYCAKLPNASFKSALFAQYNEATVRRKESCEVRIETIQSYGMPVGQEVFETCFYIGRLQLLLEQNGIRYEMVKRSDIKLHHCGTTRAKDTNIKAALVERFGDKGTKSSPGFFYGVTGDGWSACAIALYGHDKLNGR